MNALMQWCDAPEQGIELTSSRAYQRNDQAWVEQKNGMLILRVVGYERLVGLEAAQLLSELYAALRLFTNLFQPSFKLKSRVREGGRIKRQQPPAANTAAAAPAHRSARRSGGPGSQGAQKAV